MLLKNSIWLILASVTAGGLGYVFQILLGRMLEPGEYALFSAIMAVYMIAISPLQTLTLVIAERVSTYNAQGKLDTLAAFFRFCLSRTFIVSASIVVVLGIFLPQIQESLKTDSTPVVVLLGVLIVASIPFQVSFGILQGLQKFKAIAASQVSLIGLKLIGAVLLVYFGFGVAGATTGVLLSTLVVSVWMYGRFDFVDRQIRPDSFTFSLQKIGPIVAANVAFTIVAQVDLVLVNYYFDAETAGNYAIAAVFGKAAMHIPAGITTALFPIVVAQYEKNEGSRHLLLQSIGLAFLLSLAVGYAYYLLSEWFVLLVFGAGYAEAALIMKWYGLAMVPLALIVVTEHYLIAKSRMLFVYFFLLALPVLVVTVHFYHPTPFSILLTITAISTGICLAGLSYLIFSRD